VEIHIKCECETRFKGEDGGYCGICAEVCPEVFEIVNYRARVKEEVDLERYLKRIKLAEANCPVEAIVVKI